jgi:type II secretory pathway pseudopilin PulG
MKTISNTVGEKRIVKALRAFTIIETVVYLGLFSILIGGAVVGAYNVFESAGREQTRAMLQEEGSFLIGKINWAVSGASSVNTPGGGQFGSSLSVNKVTGLAGNGQPIIETVIINIPVSPGNIQIQNGANPAVTLNNTNVTITRLGFLHTLPTGNGIIPESIEASTTMTALAPNGMVISQDFSTTVYIRR